MKRVRTSAPHQHTHLSKDGQRSITSQSHGEALLSDIISSLKQALFPESTSMNLYRHPNSQTCLKLCLKWILGIYCFLSFIVFSLDLYAQTSMTGIGDIHDEYDSSTAFDDTSATQRLSRLFSLQSNDYLGLDPFIIRAQERSEDIVTACIWTHELQDFEMLRSWVSQWQGPISMLMTTTSKPESSSFANLLHRLHDLSNNPLSGLSVHLLRVGLSEQASSNSYINLARFFASTSVVMLIPANVSEPPPASHKTVVSQLVRSSMRLPLIVTGTSTHWSNFSTLPQLSPTILHRDHPVWCTERLFSRKTRTSEWTVCLWQLWLHSFGDFVGIGMGKGATYTISTEISNDRLSARFKVETCDLMVRTIAILGVKKQKDGKKKLQWLKETCGQNSVDKMFKYIDSER